MRFRKTLLATVIVATLGGASFTLPALADVEIFFNSAPPAVRYERVPTARRGYLWVPGYWDGNRGKHVWRKGRWERQRTGYVYAQPRWVERNNGWALERGRWNRGDRDGDGVPNRVDSQPNNPNRR